MTPRHHLDDATLMGYATGSLPEAYNLVIACHLSLCDTCRATAESFDVVGGEVLERVPAAAMAGDSFARTLARAEAAPAPAPVRHPAGTLPAPLQDYVGGDLESIRWRPVGMGVKQAVLPTSAAASARLLFIPAGAAMPDHSHAGQEFTLVLQGAFSDGDDTFARGDIEIADEDVTHTPVAAPGDPCICLAVTDAPLRFQGWLPRLVQRFIGI